MGSALKALLIFGIAIGALVGVAAYLGTRTPEDTPQEKKASSMDLSLDNSSSPPPIPPIQQELNERASKIVAQLRQEDRLNLTMAAQLKTFQEMLRQVQSYAKKVEHEIDIVREISQNEFQEDVALQASLFSGKKPSLVAQHLEEFKASRVGAILAKMKEKEASNILDVWAKQKNPKISTYYRSVIAAYLNNKRRDANPELFNQLTNTTEGLISEAPEEESPQEEAL